MNSRRQLTLVCALTFITGCSTQHGILKNFMPDTFEEWCTLEMREQQQILVTGHVQAPGVYNVFDGITLVDAIKAAEGYTWIANRANVTVIRDRISTRHDLRGDSHTNSMATRLQGGDRVVVRQRMLVHVTPNPTVWPPKWKTAKIYYESMWPNKAIDSDEE